MTIDRGLTRLAELVERVESKEVQVEDVALRRCEGEEAVDVDLSLRLSLDGDGGAVQETDPTADADQDGADGVSGTGENGSSASEPAGKEASTGEGGAGEAPGSPDAVDSGGTSGGPETTAPRASHGNDGGSASGNERADEPGSEAVERGSGEGDAGRTDDGPRAAERVECRVEGCAETFETDHGMKIHAAKVHDSADELPAHRDPERLRAVYEARDTFEAMTEALDADVTAQTVRRNMIARGIHDPGEAEADADPDPGAGESEPADDEFQGGDSGDESESPEDDDARGVPGDREPTSGPADPETAVEQAAGDVEELLPEPVDPDELIAAVERASTLYEVQQALGTSREEVQTLLDELGLLEFVHGRVATQDEREADRDDIERRLREAAGD